MISYYRNLWCDRIIGTVNQLIRIRWNSNSLPKNGSELEFGRSIAIIKSFCEWQIDFKRGRRINFSAIWPSIVKCPENVSSLLIHHNHNCGLWPFRVFASLKFIYYVNRIVSRRGRKIPFTNVTNVRYHERSKYHFDIITLKIIVRITNCVDCVMVKLNRAPDLSLSHFHSFVSIRRCNLHRSNQR